MEQTLTGRPEHSLQKHHAIVEAVINHEPDKAEIAMRRRLSLVADALR